MHEIVIDRPIGLGPNELSASEFKNQLRKIPATQPLVVHIDSEGGSVFDGLSIYDAIRGHAGKVTAVVQNAFSIASLIPCAADEVEIAANGYLMLHSPAMDTYGTAADLKKSGELLDSLQEKMAAIYAARIGKPLSYIQQKIKTDWFLSAEQAVLEGFANRVVRGAVVTAKASPMRRFPALRAAIVASANRPKTQPQRVVRAALARWQAEMDAAMLTCGHDRLRAARVVESKHPGLRLRAVAEANAR